MNRSSLVTGGAMLAACILAALDYWSGPLFSMTLFYVIPVGFVAWYAGWRRAVIISGLCILGWIIADFNTLGTRIPFWIDIWNGLISLTVLLLIGRTLAATKHAIDLEAATVRKVQDALLPPSVPHVAGLEIGARYRPAGDLSGDYYDLIGIDSERLVVCVADVAGKGVGPALLMANLQGMVRALAGDRMDLAAICHRLNRLVEEAVSPGLYVTFFIAVIDPAAQQLAYVNAGHDPPLLFRYHGGEERLAATGLPLGIFLDVSYEAPVVRVESGDRLILYTDGITEARGRRDEEFGIGRLVHSIEGCRNDTPDALASRVMEDIRAFERGAPRDDATLVVVRLESAATIAYRD